MDEFPDLKGEYGFRPEEYQIPPEFGDSFSSTAGNEYSGGSTVTAADPRSIKRRNRLVKLIAASLLSVTVFSAGAAAAGTAGGQSADAPETVYQEDAVTVDDQRKQSADPGEESVTDIVSDLMDQADALENGEAAPPEPEPAE
ncbi:MAG: hypothetical protein IJH77_06490 [Mogibacterium sp.]|nr:hypothetical protein [Mogibacterium sp.]